MSVAEAIAAHAAVENELARRDLDDGSAVVLLGRTVEPRFVVAHLRGNARVEVIRTRYPDEAEAVFGAFDGRDRGWHAAYLPIGRAFEDPDGKTVAVEAAGSTIEDCVRGFLESHGEGLREGSLADDGDAPSERFQWSVRFVSDRTGTAFKAAGRRVPGGVVMTWCI